MLSISERFCETLILTPSEDVVCDFALSEGLLATREQASQDVFRTLTRMIPTIWCEATRQLSDNPHLGKNRHLGLSIILVTNAEIHALNQEYRDKDKATDVLTFPVAQFIPAGVDNENIADLPEAQLGEIYVSLEWAEEEAKTTQDRVFNQAINYEDPTVLFLVDRVCHGILHLLGVHHDTEDRYNQVVQIQYQVANAVFKTRN